jgi:Divergent InlB B-repeat domain
MVSGGGAFAGNSSQTVTATASSGYSFVNWTANGNIVSTSASASAGLSRADWHRGATAAGKATKPG